MAHHGYRFGNAEIKVAGVAPAPALLMVIHALSSVTVAFDLVDKDKFLKVEYTVQMAEELTEDNVLTFLNSMQIEGDLDTHNVIQHYRCDLHTYDKWKRVAKKTYKKQYLYTVHEPSLPSIAEFLEEWRTFVGTAYDSTVDDVWAFKTKNGTELEKLTLTI